MRRPHHLASALYTITTTTTTTTTSIPQQSIIHRRGLKERLTRDGFKIYYRAACHSNEAWPSRQEEGSIP
ncbi:hypothetical protein E2C01_052250 [Portunus trituberculatus]|uniref:Uncharacterized protein n=1 Tax=Portunus trituberculatus TaxID=210409 RepID=A0A5B7GNW1_PORTR|nr:hypothetical protein [Portunus trituberculatus]